MLKGSHGSLPAALKEDSARGILPRHKMNSLYASLLERGQDRSPGGRQADLPGAGTAPARSGNTAAGKTEKWSVPVTVATNKRDRWGKQPVSLQAGIGCRWNHPTGVPKDLVSVSRPLLSFLHSGE